MMNPALRPDASLAEFLMARARAASDGRLVADVLAGTLAALGVAVWRRIGWVIFAGAALALAAFGLWGILDREARERDEHGPRPVLRLLGIARVLATVFGFGSAAVALFSVLQLVLGTWIS